MLLLGNEAITRGAIEAGLAFATAYPGTPSSEVALNFYQIKQESDLYFEYSTNEKVALEVAAGAAVSGLRTMVTMKHVGLNVAADPLMTLAYTGVIGGMVILTADDPSLFSSQNEQDNRYYARISGLPMLEPTTPQEAKDMTLAAFDLSEKLKVPVLLRTTTRINHSRGIVTLGEIKPRQTQGFFKKDPFSYVTVPAVSRNLHVKLLEKYDQALQISNRSPFNEIIGTGKWGIVTQGVSFAYVQDALEDLKVKDSFTVLKVGFSYPFPEEMGKKFLNTGRQGFGGGGVGAHHGGGRTGLGPDHGKEHSHSRAKGSVSSAASLNMNRPVSAPPSPSIFVYPMRVERRWIFPIFPPFPAGPPIFVPGAPIDRPIMRSRKWPVRRPSIPPTSAVIPWACSRR